MIDCNDIKTVKGESIHHIIYKPYNSAGAKVSYPLRESIIRRLKPLKLEYCTWNMNGECQTLPDSALWPDQAEKKYNDAIDKKYIKTLLNMLF